MSTWTKVTSLSACIPNGGVCVKLGDEQIAIFNVAMKEWYAVQNLCPHQAQMVLSRGLIGDAKGEPKVACPLHKNQFSLATGEHLGGTAEWKLKTYPIKLEDGDIYLDLTTASVKQDLARA